MRVNWNGEVSETHHVDLAVPQGSILGPILFNVFINSLSTAAHAKKIDLILYADDSILMVAASAPQELNYAIRYDFNLIFSWYIDKKLTQCKED